MNEKPLQREQARVMYVTKLKTAKAIGLKLKVTEKTVGGWIKRYQWRSAREAFIREKLEKQQSVTAPAKTLTDFMDYLKTQNRGLARKVEPILTNYTKLL